MGTKKLKFKAGNIVKVMPYKWYDFFKDKDGNVMPKDVGVEGAKHYFTKEMAKWCGTYFEIIDVIDGGYKVYGMDQIFEDWMIENKNFNRIQNKIEKSMKTEKMTIAKAQNYVKNTKYIVCSEDESRKLQEKLFEIGCEWLNSGKIVCNTEYPFLYVSNKFMITCENKACYSSFESDSNEYKQTDHIINIEIEIPKFDPNTLKPFDRVLVRDNVNNVWKARFFDRYFSKQLLTTDGLVYNYCIPYNDETKHLHGTTEDEPDFYKID